MATLRVFWQSLIAGLFMLGSLLAQKYEVDPDFNPSGRGLCKKNLRDIGIWSVSALAFSSGGEPIVAGEEGGPMRLTSQGCIDEEHFSLPTLRDRGVAGGIHLLLSLSDGKIFIAGSFTEVNGVPRRGIARLNPDGRLDPAFNPGRGATRVYAAVELPDKKLLLGGAFTSYNDYPQPYLVRILPGGGVDATFRPVINGSVLALTPLSDGRILVGGDFTSFNGRTAVGIVRLFSNGEVDTTFEAALPAGARVRGAIELPSRFVLVYTGESIYLLQPNGQLDVNFHAGLASGGQIQTVHATSLGAIYVGGNFRRYNDRPGSYLIRLHGDGTIDSTFRVELDNPVQIIREDGQGRIYIGGKFTTVNGFYRPFVIRMDRMGNIDYSYGRLAGIGGMIWHPITYHPRYYHNNTDNVWDIYRQPDRKIMIGGNFQAYNGTTVPGLARLLSNGELDTTFTPEVGPALRIFPLSQGGYLVFTPTGIHKLFPDGRLDPSFVMDTAIHGTFWGGTLLSDGRLIAVGDFRVSIYDSSAVPYIVCLLPDGQIDPTFYPSWIPHGRYPSYPGGVPEVVASYSDGRFVIVGGRVWETLLFRFWPNGLVDTSFKSEPLNSSYSDLAVQPDGKVIGVGCFSAYGDSTGKYHVVRILPDGKIDPDFQTGSGAWGQEAWAQRIFLAPDGKIYIGGTFSHFDGREVWGLVRLHPNGAVDTTFQVQNSYSYRILAIWEESDSTLLVGGWRFLIPGQEGITRLRRASLASLSSVSATGEGFKVYPNPARNGFFIETPQADSFHLYTIEGRYLRTYEVSEGKNWITESLPSGLYLLQGHKSQKIQKVLYE